MTKVLVTGANGFLGQHLCLFLVSSNYEVLATGRGTRRFTNSAIFYREADLTDAAQVKRLLNDTRPHVIVHTAALSKPDECDNNRDYCEQVNVVATRSLVENTNAFFVYTSTDFIFGENGPHSESTLPDPLNFYGQTKLKAEEIIMASSLDWAVVRPVFIYGQVWEGMRPTFLHWVKNSLIQGKQIKVVSDQLRTPTYVLDICKGIETIIKNRVNGDYHLAGKDLLSPYQMAVKTADVLGLDHTLIEEVTSDTFPEPVRRAKRSGLTIEKAIKDLGYAPVSFEEGVRLTFKD